MKDNEQNLHKYLAPLARFRDLSSGPVEPAWDRIQDRLRDEPEDASEAAERAIDAVQPISPFLKTRHIFMGTAAAITVTIGLTLFLLSKPSPVVVRDGEGRLFRMEQGQAQSFRAGDRISFGEVIYSNGGSGSTVVLPDGSQVEMRSKSELFLEHADDGVRIHLNKGGIIVNAAQQHGHLYVQTKDVTVSVVGTVFLVNAEESGSRVAVIEGEVRVIQGGAAEKTLGPGQQVTSSPRMEQLPLAEEIAWSREAPAHVALLQQATRSTPSTGRDEPLAFEEASIRPAAPVFAQPGARSGGGGNSRGACSIEGMQLDPRRLSLKNVSVNELVGLAIGPCHGLAGGPGFRRLSGGPDWIRSERWDLEALIPESSEPLPSTPYGGPITEFVEGRSPRMQRMLLTFLERRLQLDVRREMKEMPVYVLTVAPDGPKFQGKEYNYRMSFKGPGMVPPDMDQAAGANVKPMTAAEGASVAWSNIAPCFRQPDQTCQVAMYLNQRMNIIVNHLSWWAGRPILDRTGIQEKVSFAAEWPYFYLNWGRGRGAPPPPTFQEVSRGLQAVGLQLKEDPKGPAEVFVIVRVEKPSEN